VWAPALSRVGAHTGQLFGLFLCLDQVIVAQTKMQLLHRGAALAIRGASDTEGLIWCGSHSSGVEGSQAPHVQAESDGAARLMLEVSPVRLFQGAS
jgi:hypothetical protein